MIHIYCGDGKGKTTSAVGLAVRMAGYEKRILFIQFLKGGETGELKLLNACKDITVMRCDKEYGFFGSMSDTEKADIIECHNNNLQYVTEHMNEFDLIVMDEIFAAYNYDLADKMLVRKIISSCKCELVLTGRDPEQWFIDRADYVSEIKKIKHPFDNGIDARKGIEY